MPVCCCPVSVIIVLLLILWLIVVTWQVYHEIPRRARASTVLEGRPKGPHTTTPRSRPYYDRAAYQPRVIVRARVVRWSGEGPWVALPPMLHKKWQGVRDIQTTSRKGLIFPCNYVIIAVMQLL